MPNINLVMWDGLMPLPPNTRDRNLQNKLFNLDFLCPAIHAPLYFCEFVSFMKIGSAYHLNDKPQATEELREMASRQWCASD